MRAVRLHRFGGPGVLRLEEVDLPVPGRGEMLIKLEAGGLNPVDAKIRTGKFHLFRPKLPAILGRDIAGTVVAIGGRKRLKGFAPGTPVFGMIDYDRGAYAEYTLASARELAVRPARLRARLAGVLGVAALTAWQGLFDHGRLRRGQRVLIHAGAGGVGHLAVQFARWKGANVIATAGTADLAWVRSLGADRVIDFRRQRFEDEVGNIDLVLDLMGGETQARSWQVLKEKGGILVSTREPASAAVARRHHAAGMVMAVKAHSGQLAQIADLILRRKVKVTIRRGYRLTELRSAHRALEQAHGRGKLAIEF